ncbi:MAG: sodium:solute symporter family transporter [Phycisphaerae bacterium]
MKLSSIDLAIVVTYLLLVVGVGIRVKRRAAKGLVSYFLGGRQLPWWMIAMSGSSSYFDITGTMWIVSMFVAYGFCGYWIQWMWGFLIAVFYFAYMGKWIRRSGVLTGAEWMVLRFGSGAGGEAARLAYTLFAVLTLTTFIGYTAVGMGKFGAEFLPIRAWVGPHYAAYADQICAAAIIGITGAYVIMGGFVGLTIVEFVQTIVLTCGALMIAYLGYAAFHPADVNAALTTLASVEGRPVAVAPGDWYSLAPPWRLPAAEDMYAAFGLVLITFLGKGLLLGISGPEQLYDFQKFLAAKNPREASKIGMLWGVFHSVRFPMAMAITVMGLVTLAQRYRESREVAQPCPILPADVRFPDRLAARIEYRAAENVLVWKGVMTPKLRDELLALGPDDEHHGPYRAAVAGLYDAARFDTEKVLPGVIANVLPVGLKGVALAALLSAFMATFSAMVNGAASYLIRDIYQHYLRPAASEAHLVAASKVASVLMILVGIGISFMSSSINTMITWILGFLGSAVLVPNVLRWYWWRLNGAGFAAGMFSGMVLSLVQALAAPAWPVYVVIPVLAGCTTVVAIAVSLVTAPTEMPTLERFYRQTQPAGAWGPVCQRIRRTDPAYRKDQSFGWDALNVLIGLPWLFALYVGPGYLIVRQRDRFAVSAAIVILGAVALYWTWYRRLPRAEDNNSA